MIFAISAFWCNILDVFIGIVAVGAVVAVIAGLVFGIMWSVGTIRGKIADFVASRRKAETSEEMHARWAAEKRRSEFLEKWTMRLIGGAVCALALVLIWAIGASVCDAIWPTAHGAVHAAVTQR